MSQKCAYQQVLDRQEALADRQQKYKERWYQRVWRPISAFVFLIIVIFDLIIMPVYIETLNTTINYVEIVQSVEQIKDPMVQAQFINNINMKDRVWEPLTIRGGGLFYGSFLAILGAAAWTRGREKVARIENGVETEDEDKKDNSKAKKPRP